MTRPAQDRQPQREAGFGAQVRYGLHRTVAGSGRRWLLLGTLLLGVVVAVLLAMTASASSVAVLASPAQLLMSVPVPLSGVLLALDWARDPGDRRSALSVVVAAVIYAAAVALAGFVICLVLAALAPSAAVGAVGTVVSVAVGGVGLQVTAQLVGTGLGFLLRRAAVAFVGTVVLPGGVWLLVGALGPLAWLQQWLTPFGATPPLVSGAPSVVDVSAWVVALVLWGGLLNGVGVFRRRDQRRGATSWSRPAE